MEEDLSPIDGVYMKLKIRGKEVTRAHLEYLKYLIKHKIKTCFYFAIAAPWVICLRLIKVFVIFRFQELNMGAFAHICVLEIYLSDNDLNAQKKKRIVDVFYTTKPALNEFMIKKWKEHVRLYPKNEVLGMIDKINQLIPGYEDHVITLSTRQSLDDIRIAPANQILMKTKPHITFTQEEEQFGNQALRYMGILENTPFICFYARDKAYKKEIIPQRDWSYHDFRDANIQSYLPMAENLVQKEYKLVRVGSKVEEPLNSSNPNIIDYPLKHRSQFMDFYLGKNCFFFLGGSSGILMIPMLFRKPTVIVNAIPMTWIPSWTKYDFFIPKKLWLRKEKRFLTFREIVDSEICFYHLSEDYHRQGIEIIENTVEEICDAGLEMESRLTGAWQTTDEELELQRRFKTISANSKYAENSVDLRVGIKFIRNNTYLLD